MRGGFSVGAEKLRLTGENHFVITEANNQTSAEAVGRHRGYAASAQDGSARVGGFADCGAIAILHPHFSRRLNCFFHGQRYAQSRARRQHLCSRWD